MKLEYSILFLYIITVFIIGWLLYLAFNPKTIKIYAESPPPTVIQTHHWGYGWRPWWRRFDGVPGFGPIKPIEIKPKPIIIPKRI